jgi:hypothetical protein
MLSETITAGEIWAGESLQVAISWHDFSGQPEIPATVVYQAFDAVTDAAIGDDTTVTPTAADMSFVVPSTSLLASSAAKRKIKLVIRGTFSDGTVLPVVSQITVKKVPAFV